MSETIKESVMLYSTAARLLQATDLAKRVRRGGPIRAATAAIIGIDLADGILARRIGVEGPKRRALDSMVDAAIITAGLVSTYQKHPKSRPFIGALAAREMFVGSGWALDLAKSKQVKKGDDFHKLPSLSIAAFCVAANHYGDKTMRVAGGTAVAINAALAFDYYKGWTEPGRNTVLDNGVEQVPGFYEARTAFHKLSESRLQLTSDDTRQLPMATQEYIEGSCIELPIDGDVQL